MIHTLSQFNHQNICILGFGREGRATYQALQHDAPDAHITIADANAGLTGIPESAQTQLGDRYLRGLDAFDIIIKTPGIPNSPELAAVKSKTTTATQLFLQAARTAGVTVIGVTGSKGKSTTSALIHQALRAGGKQAELMGNIGNPMLSYLDQLTPDRMFVAELSSYQLQDVTISPHIAVITSFFPEHLTYHGSVENYLAAKKHIAQFQTPDDFTFYNASSRECTHIAQASPGAKIPFTAHDFPVPISQTHLLGEHNRSNLAAAYKAVLHCGVPADTALEALKNFEGLPHRLQSLGEHAGITWVDDSFSTAPEATLAALRALEGRVGTLIVGGVNRGYHFDDLGRYLAQSGIQTIILFPETGQYIKQAILQNQGGIIQTVTQTSAQSITRKNAPSPPKQFFETTSMAQAVTLARQHTQPGKICLLSSGAPSFNLFKNFEERGELFAAAVRVLS